ncbi:hypothetical protein [Parvularcula lutaonensis]|uniref:Uncharacterized protein n=1 Tax=Parvularcula lutaonensis TaxID=491923 RepID=A0ABV7M8F5_9PROT|nr:hypothetical protein [Parvularcula lutaonensis]GGY56266.1 hypothetical protein GCM10007148_27260 [Parvularcula lutaonensis]
MRRPLDDILSEHPELSRAESRAEAEEHLEELFLEAQKRSNAFAAERLEEIYEVAERALALGASFPPVPIEERRPAAAWFLKVPGLLAQYGGGLLLAACAPLVADESTMLAVACGVGAVLTLVGQRRGGGGKPRREPPKAVAAKFEGLVSAAERTLSSMTAPLALEAPSRQGTSLSDDDVLSFLQDAVMVRGLSDEADELAANAERLIERAGYRIVCEGSDDLFEVMIDPEVAEEILLKPALVHRTDPGKIVFGVKVRGRS